MAVVQLLLTARADFNHLTNDSSCPLYAGIILHIVKFGGIGLCQIYISACYCFPTAVDGGYKDIVELLLRHGAEVNGTHTASCWTCLHQAVYEVTTQITTAHSIFEKNLLLLTFTFFMCSGSQ